MFDESIMRSTAAIDTAVVDKTYHLTSALDAHAVSFRETIGKQATDLDEALMHGINSVRRASENISRQSMKAMEGLAGQSEMLKNISENLLGQISGITGRFENQGQSIVKAANALETVNFKIDKTLQNRHADLSRTLEQLSGKAGEFATFVEGYSTSIEGSLSEADIRARTELERMRVNTTAASERTLEDLRNRLSTVSSAMTSELGTMTNRFASTSEEMRRHASRAASEIAAEQGRLREQMERLPIAAQESSESMRRALQDQIKALDQLSALTARTAAQRDVTQPMGADVPPLPQRPGGGQETARSLTSLSSTIAQEMGGRQERPSRGPGGRPGPASDGREGWSLGDLLARASRDEDGAAHGGGGGGRNGIQPRSRGHRTRPRYCDVGRHLDAPQGRPARRHGALDLQRAGPHVVRRGRSSLPCRAGARAHRRPLSRRLRADHLRIRSERSLGPHDAVPSRLRRGPRVSLPRARLRPHRLRAIKPYVQVPARQRHAAR